MTATWMFIRFLLVYLGLLFVCNCGSCPLSLKDCRICEINVNESVVIKDCKNFNCEEQNNAGVWDEMERDINIIISFNHQLKSITIDRAPLRKLSPEFCSLVQLQQIKLSSNCLGELPLGCFKNFRQIQSITITDNLLKRLEDGIFDGLNTLEVLNLDSNSIEYVDERVFSSKDDLLKLRELSLNDNELTSVGAWIFIRNLAVNNSIVSLRSNKILKFTNALNWTFRCKDRPKWRYDGVIDFTGNRIEHVMDLKNAYFEKTIDLVCLFPNYGSFKVWFRANQIICDCMDYQIITIIKKAAYSPVMNDAQCMSPVELQDTKLIVVPLDKFVCNIIDKCPLGCDCIEQPSSSTLFVNCGASYSEDHLPKVLPETKLRRYDLKFNGVNLKKLDSKEYFKKTWALNLSGSNITSIDGEFLTSIKYINNVNLDNNLIQSLPLKVCLSEKFSFQTLSLYNNPWKCDCNNKWLKGWLNDNKGMLIYPDSIQCAEPYWLKGKSILQVEDDNFCSDPSSRKQQEWTAKQLRVLLATLLPVIFVATLATSIAVVVRKFRVEIHATFNIHPFDKDECDGEEMLYDVFLSSSFTDRRFAIDLVHRLERKGYRVCFHEKDFLAGPSIASNICRAVVYSKRVVCILTKEFINSPYCMYEFETALHRNIEIKKNRLLMLLRDATIFNKDELSEEMFEFLSTHTYIEMKEGDNWVDQMYYSLPLNKITYPLQSSLQNCSDIELLIPD